MRQESRSLNVFLHVILKHKSVSCYQKMHQALSIVLAYAVISVLKLVLLFSFFNSVVMWEDVVV